MSFTFTKLFSGLTESTVWVEPYPTRVLWVSLLSWADQNGRVFGSIPGIARRAGINMDECETAMVSFMSPDRHSRTPDNDGRRIEKIDGGWRLLNYTKYREMRDAETRREYQREWDREHRPSGAARAKKQSDSSPTSPTSPTKVRESPTQAEAEEEVNLSPLRAVADATRTEPSGFSKFWEVWPKGPRKVGKAACFRKWQRAGLESLAEQIVAHVAEMRLSQQWVDGFDPAPATYLNQRRWEDGPPQARAAEPKWFQRGNAI